MPLPESISLKIDRLLINLRWASLLGSALILFPGGGLPAGAAYIWLAGGIWNALLDSRVTARRRNSGWMPLILLFDCLIAYVICYFSRSDMLAVAWIGVLPLVTSVIYFGWRGGVYVSVLNLLAQGLIAWLSFNMLTIGRLIGVLALLYFPTVLVLAWVLDQYRGREVASRQADQLEQNGKERFSRESRSRLYQAIVALSDTLQSGQVLEKALALIEPLIVEPGEPGQSLVSLALLWEVNDEGEKYLQISAARNITPSDKHFTLPGTSGLLRSTLDTVEPQMAACIGIDPELGKLEAIRACQAAYCVPLWSESGAQGVLVFAHPETDYFNRERCDIVDIISNHAIITLQNARIFRGFEQEKGRLVELEADTRKKLARELHDGPTQSISALAMRANFARRMLTRDVNTAAEELAKIEDLARHTTKEMRQLLFSLRPLMLEPQGLLYALTAMAEQMGDIYEKSVIIDADPLAVASVEPDCQGSFLAIAEEAVNNAYKHAQAEHIWIRVKYLDDDLVYLQVEDDGVGFDPQISPMGGQIRECFGLNAMRARAELINGLFHIDSGAGRGTRVYLLIPLCEAAVDRMRSDLFQ